MIHRICILSLALLACLSAAQIDDRDWPSVVPTAAIDVPMRDAAITRGPDGAYYLTGTLAAQAGAWQQAPDLRSTVLATRDSQGPDFANCRVIKLWRSTDLKRWDDLGVVWDLKEDVFGARGDQWHERIRRQRIANYTPGPQGYGINLGITGPEAHHIQGAWYICFALNEQSTHLIRSTSGKPEGPYEPWSQITATGGSPSLFVDDDGSVYWLTDGGWIARMTPDLRALAEPPRLIQPAPERAPNYQKDAPRFLDAPRQLGSHGAFLFKHRGRYFLTAGDWTHRLGSPCDDTYLCYADSLAGPWSRRHLMVPHGGGITVFAGPRSSAVPRYYHQQQAFYLGSVSKNARPKAELADRVDDPTFYVAYAGNDDRARLRDRAALLPLEWTGPERPVFCLHDDCESFPRKPQHIFTERGPWPQMAPALQGLSVRDIHVRPMPDGELVLSGSITGKPKELFVYRSRDLLDWQSVGPVWTYDQIEWLPTKLPMPAWKPGDTAWQHTFWDVQVLPWKGDLYIAFDIFMNKEHPEHRGCGVLKSTTGTLEGPYVSLGKVGGQLGQDPGPIMPNFFAGQDGRLYAKNWLNWKQVVAEADLAKPGWAWDYRPVDGGVFKHMPRMDPFGIEGIEDRVVFMTQGNGPEGPAAWNQEASYDVNYVTAAGPWGPVISSRMRTIPHAGAANCFRDAAGRWWRVCFGSDYTGPWNDMLGFIPLRIEHQGAELIIDVEDAERLDERCLKILGGGRIAEVRTVVQTLP